MCELATAEMHHLRISGHADRSTGNRAETPVVVWAKTFEANRRAALSASMMAVRDRIQRERDVVHLLHIDTMRPRPDEKQQAQRVPVIPGCRHEMAGSV